MSVKRFVIAGLCMICAAHCNAQMQVLKYLQNALEDIKEDTTGMPELLGLGKLRDFQPPTDMSASMLDMWDIINSGPTELDTAGKSMFDLGNEAFDIEEYDQALGYYKKNLAKVNLPKQRKQYAATARKLAFTYINISDYRNATDYLLKALHSDESSRDTLGIIADNIVLGQIKTRIFYYEEAKTILESALQMARGRNAALERDANYYLALLLIETNDKSRALNRMLRARTIDLSPPAINNLIDDDIALSFLYFDIGDTIRCAKLMIEATKYIVQNDMQAKSISSLIKMSRLLRMLGKYEAAEANLLLIDMMSLLFGGHLQDVATSKEELAYVYADMKEYKKAYSTLLKYRVLSDSLFNIEKNKEIKRLEVQFETAKKERALAKSEKEIKEKELALTVIERELLRANLERSEKERKLIASENIVQANKLVIADKEAKRVAAELQNELKTKQMVYSGLLGVLLIALISMLYYYRQRYLKKLYNSEALTALKSQMTRHLTFNGLESIRYMVAYEPAKANDYLVRYASFLRKVLDNTDKPEITLQEEIEELKQYMKLEQMRTESCFDYEFDIADNLLPSSIVVPSLILQPIIENSILHGFKDIDYIGHIRVSIYKQGDKLICVISDNGKGRQMNKQMQPGRSSKGTKITKRRIELYNSAQNMEANFAIRDIQQGVEVTITLPVRLAA